MTNSKITALEQIATDAESVKKLLGAFRIFVNSDCPQTGDENFSVAATLFAQHMDEFHEVLFTAYKKATAVHEQICTLLNTTDERSETE